MNDTPPPPLPSGQRLARAVTWLTLTIVWFTAHILVLVAPNQAKLQLAAYVRAAQWVIIAKALRQTPASRTQPRSPHFARTRTITLRRMTGSVLRRALRGHTAAERARAIYGALTNPNRPVAHMKRRLARRLTKLRVPPLPPRDIGSAAPTPMHDPRSIDSS